MERPRPRRWSRLVFAASVAVVGGAVLAALGLSPASGRVVHHHDCPMPDRALGAFVQVPGGRFIEGAQPLYPEEGPPSVVHVSPFLLQAHEVTNDQFQAFVDATGYVTEAEEGHGSAMFVGIQTPASPGSWWQLDRSASWRAPEGTGSDLVGRGSYPVVHVSLRDARRYAEWAGGRLPSEIEWEYAASLGLFDPDDPESGIRGPAREPRANIWDGHFPFVNTEEDGFAGAAPVGCFPANLIGAYDMIGNVWEWTDTRFDEGVVRFTIKGGSYLCGGNYCRRYRAAARQGMEPDVSTAHIGFRIARDIEG